MTVEPTPPLVEERLATSARADALHPNRLTNLQDHHHGPADTRDPSSHGASGFAEMRDMASTALRDVDTVIVGKCRPAPAHQVVFVALRPRKPRLSADAMHLLSCELQATAPRH